MMANGGDGSGETSPTPTVGSNGSGGGGGVGHATLWTAGADGGTGCVIITPIGA